MDPRFVMHKEDVDLAWRLQRAGFAAGVDGDAVAFHARGTTRAADRDSDDRVPFVRTIRAVLRQEREKSVFVRRLAWRNHLLLVIKNDTRAGLRVHFGAILRLQAGYLATGLILDPWGTVVARLGAIGPIIAAMADRRSWPPGTAVDVRPWLD
jgi:GT2 family glycosyltransferase